MNSSDRETPSFELTQEVDGLLPENHWRRKMTLEELAQNIAAWGEDRGITVNGNPSSQMVKLCEEMGELAAGIARNDKELIMDSIGDCIVVLIMIAELTNNDTKKCVEMAWDEIKDRKGYLNSDGIFIKESDV